MADGLQSSIDAILRKVTSGSPRVPGVVAIATDRNGEHLRGRCRQAHARSGRRHDDRQRLRDLLDHQGDRRHRRAAAHRGRPARSRCAGEDLCPGHRQAAGSGGVRRSGTAQAAPAQARRHHEDAAAAHRGLRLRLLQRELQPPRQGARAAERAHGNQGVDQHAAPVRSRRRVGIRLEHRLGRSGRRRHHRPAARRGHGGADLRAARHGEHRLQADAAMRSRLARHASARGRRLADADDRLRAAAGAGGPHGRPRALLDRGGLLQVHPHVAERRRGRARAGPEAGDRARRRRRTTSAA